MAFTESEKKELVSLIKEAISEKPTKAEIMAVKDTAERQRLIAENMNLFVDDEE